jgi:D-alanyl-D-alanine carboxypeptidase
MPKSTPLTQSIDALLAPVFAPGDPGAAVIVTQGGRTIFRKGYGLANLELKVPVRPEMVFRIGSVTKQFTAVAVLMLVQEGKLALEADLTAYLPDYPTQGEKITIRHLLTHTSGIKSYTSMPEWMPLWRKDLPLPELIAVFKDQPMDFHPGESWNYNNSAFVLLGAIIEQVSGQRYAQFLAERIFQPLKMTSTRYDVTEAVVPGRVAGYAKSSDGWENAAYLSMTHPHGAGALMSSVDDLARWDQALYGRKLVKPTLLQQAWRPYILADGRSTQYGFGWGISSLDGHTLIAHGGGINGFICYGLRIPESRVYVAILTNRTGTPDGLEMLALHIACLTAGLPFPQVQPVELPEAARTAFQGVYQLNEKVDLALSWRDGKWFAQRSGGGNDELLALSDHEFCYKDHPLVRIAIQQGADGQVSGLEVRGNFGPYEPAQRTDKPLPSEKPSISLPLEVLKRYEGSYELAPGMVFEIRVKGEGLVAQPTGQNEAELFAESETKFFLKVVDASLAFVLGADGLAEAIDFKQGNFQTVAKRKR